ncbi:hypothetical protein LOZ53_004685 [Ophidiomyces ophidiicola]|nr:hypothetical protein LOZ55_005260 [Ophidiomyces ophidiicola]KAI1986496.1 hypothetical protein LOZ53_004685 [Ophidiomyces ophidiicola]KAI1995424.1 hypothetical protein LOZ54_000584 [Ophidiomyces ophidiicola]KAI1997910.1 hypothetical protein LOZ51_002582 [Ophidiomyces ophidiicola]
MLSSQTHWGLPGSNHSLTQPSTRCNSPTQSAISARPHPSARYASTPPTSALCFGSIDAKISSLLQQDVDKSIDSDYQLKLALTDLLNCSDIKSDQEVRRWVQNRLMDTEHRLKARRKSRILQCDR